MTSNTIDNDRTMAGSEGTLLAGRYRIVRQLGQGGMGSVWLAEDTQLDGKQFAIKMLPSILVSNKRAYAQLKSEALVAMKLSHSNIVTLRAFEENSGNPFLVMDYIDGQTLDDYLADIATASSPSRNGGDAVATSGLSEQEVVRLLKPIAAALDYAHKEGVVHRDVKPANVMIRKDGRPFVLDFGISREMQETMTRVTGKLSSGTLLYMSPEQLNGDAPKSAQDVYSFAAMAYECMSGHPPFYRGAIEDQIKNKQPEPLMVNQNVPQSIAHAIMSGLAKKPEDRPATCMSLLDGGDCDHRERLEGSRLPANDSAEVCRSSGLVPPSREGYRSDISSFHEWIRSVARDFAVARDLMKRVLSGLPYPIQVCLGFVAFSGRARRLVLWLTFLCSLGIFLGITAAVIYAAHVNAPESICLFLYWAVNLVLALRLMAVQVRRLHDIGVSGWWLALLPLAIILFRLVGFVSLGGAVAICLVALFVCNCINSQPGENKYGPNPKDRGPSKTTEERTTVETESQATKDINQVENAKSALAPVSPRKASMDKCDDHTGGTRSSHLRVKAFCIVAFLFALAGGAYYGWNTYKDGRRANEDHLAPSAKVVVTVNGTEVYGAKLNDGVNEHVSPIYWTLENGKSYGPYEVTYESGGRRYFGKFDAVTVDWSGAKTFTVALKESTWCKVDDTKTRESTNLKVIDTQILNLPGGATMEMIYVKPGSFMMGSPTSEGGRLDGETQHRVTLTKGYWLGKYEVTQAQWRSVMGTNPSERKGDSLPVESVSWNDCQEFIRKVDAETRRQLGGGARLPTEAEWEYACRAGTTTAYSWGNALNGDRANCDGNNPCGTTTKGPYRLRTAPVGSYPANPWGFYDMHGNVWEWCSDWYGNYSGNATDPIGSASGDGRVLRGGTWCIDARFCRSAVRSSSCPGNRNGGCGFRLCCSAGPRE